MQTFDGFESEGVRLTWKFFLSSFLSKTSVIDSVSLRLDRVVDAGAEEGALEGSAVFEGTGEYDAIDVISFYLLTVALEDAVELDDVLLSWGIFYLGFLFLGGGEPHEHIGDLRQIQLVAREDCLVVVLLLPDGSLQLGDIG